MHVRRGLNQWIGRLFGDRRLWLTLALTVFAWAPLLSPGYFFKAHDARHSVFFLVEFDAALRDGAWWPRWAPDQALGYGYPLWIFYSPLSYYLAEAFHLLGLGFTAAVKATYLVGFLAAAWAMYALIKRWWGPSAGMVAAVAYTYVPYHLLDIYVRSALAEFMAFLWFPLTLLAFDTLIARGGRRPLAGAAIAFAGLVLTHSVTALIYTPFLAAAVLWELWRSHGRAGRRFWTRAGQALGAAALGIGISAIFLIPMILERPNIVQEQWMANTYQYFRHFVYPYQFLSPLWDFLYSVEGPQDGMSFQLGAVVTVLALGATLAALRAAHRDRGRVLFMALATALALLLMTPVARPLWDAIPPLQLVQFPWRLLAITAVTLSVLAGAAVVLLPDARSEATASVCALLLILASLPYTIPQFTPVTPEDESALAVIRFETDYPDMVGITAWAEEVPTDSPLLSQYWEGRPLEKIRILRGRGEAETIHVGGAHVEGRVRAEEPVVVQFLTYWFPGWQARVDGEPVPSQPEGPYGLITLEVPAGEHTVSIRMEGTPVRNAGAAISIVSLVLVGIIAAAPGRRRGTQ